MILRKFWLLVLSWCTSHGLCFLFSFHRKVFMYSRSSPVRMSALSDKNIYQKNDRSTIRKNPTIPEEIYSDYIPPNLVEEDDSLTNWEGYMEGFDWQLERARRLLEGPAFAPLRMTLWQPPSTRNKEKREVTPQPTFWDHSKILISNALQMAGLIESVDGAPLVQGVNTFKGNFGQFLARIVDGNLAELAGGPLFLLLQDYYLRYGSVFKLAFGPKSFIVVSDPVLVKHILKEKAFKYDKGILAEILDPIMGKGLIPADPDTWKVRRKAIVPGFHKAWLNAMMSLFVNCNQPLIKKLSDAAATGKVLNMETEFCSVALDIIGKAVFNYEFGSVTKESPIVKAVYRCLQEAEHRSVSFIPYWNLPFAKHYFPNLMEFEKNMQLLNTVLNDLIANALLTQSQSDIEELEKRDYAKIENASLLRFLVDMRGENTTSRQLRDDLMTMLIAGHETSAAVLTWTLYELAKNRTLYQRVQSEIDEKLRGKPPTYEDTMRLSLLRLCLAETLRMYPEPPLLIRRALEDDTLPKALHHQKEVFIPKGTDIFISLYNIHRSAEHWENPTQYNPYRFYSNFTNPKTKEVSYGWNGFKEGNYDRQLYPNEVNADFAFLPFGGGTRKCVGDQFAIMESIATLSVILQNFDVDFAIPADQVGMRTGATIHTENGLMMKIKPRENPFVVLETARSSHDSSNASIGQELHRVANESSSISSSRATASGSGCPF